MRFKKGQIPWNKGKKASKAVRDKMSKSRKGVPLSEAHKKSLKLTARRGIKNNKWKGDDASKIAKHIWVETRRGKARKYKCKHCGKQAQHWANKDHKYRRVLEDYMPLCCSCHLRYDIKRRKFIIVSCVVCGKSIKTKNKKTKYCSGKCTRKVGYKNYYKNNKEKVNKLNRQYWENNKEKILEQMRKKYHENIELARLKHSLAYNKRNNNIEKCLELEKTLNNL